MGCFFYLFVGLSHCPSTNLGTMAAATMLDTTKRLPSSIAFHEMGKTKKPTFAAGFFFGVVPTGIEPVTRGFSVLCSTN